MAARKRGGLAGVYGLSLAAVLFYAVPSFALANKTHAKCLTARLGPNSHVGTRQFMPLSAHAFYLVVESRLSASNVDLLCDGFQVRGIKAGAVSAQVVNLHAFGNRVAKVRVGKSVGVERFRALVNTQRYNTVTITKSAGPNPAFVVSADVLG